MYSCSSVYIWNNFLLCDVHNLDEIVKFVSCKKYLISNVEMMSVYICVCEFYLHYICIPDEQRGQKRVWNHLAQELQMPMTRHLGVGNWIQLSRWTVNALKTGLSLQLWIYVRVKYFIDKTGSYVKQSTVSCVTTWHGWEMP